MRIARACEVTRPNRPGHGGVLHRMSGRYPLTPINALHPVVMLWTAPPWAREDHGREGC